MPKEHIDLSPALDALVLRVRPDISWRKHKGKTVCQRGVPITQKRVKEHLRGGPALGACPIKEGESTTEIALLDLDSHKGDVAWSEMETHIMKVCEHFEREGLYPIAFRSSGGKGAHIYFVWADPQDARSVREFLREGIEKLGYTPGTKGVGAKTIEIFPKQDNVPAGGSGSQFILPLSGESAPLDPMLGYTPGAREDALAIDWKCSKPIPKIALIEKVAKKEIRRYDGDLGELQEMLENIPNETADYEKWVSLGMAIHAETEGSDEGLELWEAWSERCPDYSGYEELSYKWGSFRSDKANVLTVGYIKNLAENSGWHEDYAADFEDISTPEDDKVKPERLRYTRIRADDYRNRPPVKWLIKKILPRGETMAYGASIAGKTFVMLDIACHIAMGMDWNGYKTNRGKVVYICAEGAGGLTSRLKAWANHHKVSWKELGDWLHIIPETPNFLDEKDVHYLAKRLKEQDTTDLIIVDTFAQVTAGADENSGKDMGLALSLTKKLANTLKSAYCLIHHTGKNEERGARGWSGLKGQLDALFYIYREGEKRSFWIDKMKDDRDSFGFDFNLANAVVGTDEDGDAIESCFVEYAGEAIAKAKGRSKNKRGVWENTVLDIINEMEVAGEEMSINNLLDTVQARTPYDKKKKDRRREATMRALTSLKKNGEISLNGDMISTDLG
jgi:hypothetical protein